MTRYSIDKAREILLSAGNTVWHSYPSTLEFLANTLAAALDEEWNKGSTHTAASAVGILRVWETLPQDHCEMWLNAFENLAGGDTYNDVTRVVAEEAVRREHKRLVDLITRSYVLVPADSEVGRELMQEVALELNGGRPALRCSEEGCSAPAACVGVRTGSGACAEHCGCRGRGSGACVALPVGGASAPAETSERQVAPWWGAINEYAAACGADPSKHVYGNVRRQQAVAAIEAAVWKMLDEKCADAVAGATNLAENLATAAEVLVHSLGEYVRQSMHANPEWRSGVVAIESALRAWRAVNPPRSSSTVEDACPDCGSTSGECVSSPDPTEDQSGEVVGIVRKLVDENGYAGFPFLDEAVRCLIADRDAAQDRARRLEEALGMSSPWPVLSVLDRLVDAVEHMLTVHSCDAHGHEGRRYAVQAAREMRAKLAAALAPDRTGHSPVCSVVMSPSECGCMERMRQVTGDADYEAPEDRCPTCDRGLDGCENFRMTKVPGAFWAAHASREECLRNAVDWRARALAAERKREE